MANEAHEIETLEEFFVVTADVADLSTLSLATYTFQEVDFRPIDRSDWDALNLGGAFFLGCTFPDGVGVSSVRERGGYAVQSPPEGYLPKGLRPFRAFLYCQSEIQRMDAAAYAWYMSDEGKTAVSKMWQAAHDWSISDALGDLAEGRCCVVIMGGHQAGRSSDAYRQCVELTWRLAREGFIVVSGGGPGAMEAANLGAYLSAYDETVIGEALEILNAPVLDDNGDEIEFAHEYENTVSAERVVARFGAPTNQPSIGIPTYKYGHEPTNRFATYVAKFFSNALREDLLTTDVASCGVVYFPGSAGTRQEVFQQACANHYTEDPVPMVFLGTDFWGGDNGVVSLLRATAVGRPFADHILLTDGNDEVVDALTSFRSDGKAADLIATPRFPSEYWIRRDASRFHRFIGEHGADEDGDQTDNGSAGL